MKNSATSLEARHQLLREEMFRLHFGVKRHQYTSPLSMTGRESRFVLMGFFDLEQLWPVLRAKVDKPLSFQLIK